MHMLLSSMLLILCNVLSMIESKKFDCDIRTICGSDNDTLEWTSIKEDFDKLRTLNLKSSTASTLRQKHKFCTDDRLGFLLTTETMNWTIACIWTNEVKGGCFPAPNNLEPYDYIPRDEWRILLTNVRKSIGCPEFTIENAAKTQELHICRERCVDLGFAAGSWILFDAAIFSMLMAIGLQSVE